VTTTAAAPTADEALPALVRSELRIAFHKPFIAPTVVAVNGLLMAGAWFLLPTKWQNALFAVHGPFAFAVILASWMYADVPATNVLAVEPEVARASLDNPRALRRLLDAQNIMLWMLVTPICLIVALAIGIHQHDAWKTAVSVIAVIFPPFGALGIAALVGIWFPYHPIPLRERWRDRATSRWHMLWRWLALVLVPYGVVPAISVLTVLPTYLLWTAMGHGIQGGLSTTELVLGALLVLVTSILMWWIGRNLSVRVAHKHRDSLDTYLADPTRG
jgi:hypothetical protein